MSSFGYLQICTAGAIQQCRLRMCPSSQQRNHVVRNENPVDDVNCARAVWGSQTLAHNEDGIRHAGRCIRRDRDALRDRRKLHEPHMLRPWHGVRAGRQAYDDVGK